MDEPVTKERLGYAVHIISFALFFYVAATIEAPHFSPLIEYLGWILLAFGSLLVALSVATLAHNRGIGLIESGVYGVVRHPMYLGAFVLFFSWIFFHPHWIVVLISSVNMVIVYLFILQGERRNIAKFGDAYRRYMEAVPRMNPLAGSIRRLRRR